MFECNISSFNETLPRLGGLLSRLELLIFQANKNIVKALNLRDRPNIETHQIVFLNGQKTIRLPNYQFLVSSIYVLLSSIKLHLKIHKRTAQIRPKDGTDRGRPPVETDSEPF